MTKPLVGPMCSSSWWYDNTLRRGWAIRGGTDFYMHEDTWACVFGLDTAVPIFDYLRSLGEGLHELPVPMLARGSDVALQLSVSQPGPGDGCTIPGCRQGDVRQHDTEYGSFPLCAGHRQDFIAA